MQEEIENKSVNFAISTTKLTGRMILKTANVWLRHHKEAKAEKEALKYAAPIGKQSIQDLIGQDQGVTSIPIDKTGIRDFEQILNKYGIDYAITKDSNETPPRYTVFFKARDTDAMTAAFSEYGNRKLRREQRPSVLKTLRKLLAKSKETPDRSRNKEQELDL